MLLLKKKCTLCEKSGATTKEKVPVPSYTEPQTRHFCSKEHAILYARGAEKIIAAIPKCTSCTWSKVR